MMQDARASAPQKIFVKVVFPEQYFFHDLQVVAIQMTIIV
jgi:hypothetical protein